VSHEYDFGYVFQREIIHCILSYPDFIRDNRGALNYESFTDPMHRILVDEILEFFDAHDTNPSKGAIYEILKKSLRGIKHLSYAKAKAEIVEIFKLTVNKKYITGQIREFAARTGVMDIVAEFEEYADRSAYEEWYTDLGRALSLRESAPALIEYGHNIVARLKSYQDGVAKKDPIPFGIPEFDAALHGGLGRCEQGIMMGITGTGKSHLMVHVGATACELGKKVMHFSFEMGRDILLRRYDQRFAKATYDKIARSYKKTATKFKDMNLTVAAFKADSMTPIQLRSAIARYGGCDLLIVDYPALMSKDGVSDFKFTRFAIEANYLACRNLAIEFNCAVWTPFQVNRLAHATTKSEGDHITMENAAEAYGANRHADIVASWNQTEEEYELNEGRIWLDKHRDGICNQMIKVKADWRTSLVRS